MLYFFYGSNKNAARTKAHQLLEGLQAKKPNAAVFKMDAESWRVDAFEELIGGQTLFEQRYIVYGNGLFESAEAVSYISDYAADIAGSENIFILVEGEVGAQVVKKLEPYAAKMLGYGESGAAPKGSGAPKKDFSLTDAFAKRDKKGTWIHYQKALFAGSTPEELHGLLFWQLKNMQLVATTESAEAAGVHPFVYKKTREALRKYSPEELRGLSSRMVSLYHDARRGKQELSTALEHFILGL